MIYSQTSIESFSSLDDHYLSGQQKLVYDALCSAPYPLNDREISVRTSIPRHLVPARRGELVDAGLVVPSSLLTDPVTRRKTVTWTTKNKVVYNE